MLILTVNCTTGVQQYIEIPDEEAPIMEVSTEEVPTVEAPTTEEQETPSE
jgi:hypothetical protein